MWLYSQFLSLFVNPSHSFLWRIEMDECSQHFHQYSLLNYLKRKRKSFKVKKSSISIPHQCVFLLCAIFGLFWSNLNQHKQRLEGSGFFRKTQSRGLVESATYTRKNCSLWSWNIETTKFLQTAHHYQNLSKHGWQNYSVDAMINLLFWKIFRKLVEYSPPLVEKIFIR